MFRLFLLFVAVLCVSAVSDAREVEPRPFISQYGPAPAYCESSRLPPLGMNMPPPSFRPEDEAKEVAALDAQMRVLIRFSNQETICAGYKLRDLLDEMRQSVEKAERAPEYTSSQITFAEIMAEKPGALDAVGIEMQLAMLARLKADLRFYQAVITLQKRQFARDTSGIESTAKRLNVTIIPGELIQQQFVVTATDLMKRAQAATKALETAEETVRRAVEAKKKS